MTMSLPGILSVLCVIAVAQAVPTPERMCARIECPPHHVCVVDDQFKPSCKCPATCTMEYDPVCADDGQTYPTECALNSQACREGRTVKILHRGECPKRAEPERVMCAGVECPPHHVCRVDKQDQALSCVCNHVCTREWAPVCGDDGQTYGTECVLNSRACSEGRVVKIAHRGECGQEDAEKAECPWGQQAFHQAYLNATHQPNTFRRGRRPLYKLHSVRDEEEYKALETYYFEVGTKFHKSSMKRYIVVASTEDQECGTGSFQRNLDHIRNIEGCPHVIESASENGKFRWHAPSCGCVTFRATVLDSEDNFYMEEETATEGALTRTVCPEQEKTESKKTESKKKDDEDICELEPETGPCMAAFRRYYHDNIHHVCKEFLYGGCAGNANNFETMEECNEKCAEINAMYP